MKSLSESLESRRLLSSNVFPGFDHFETVLAPESAAVVTVSGQQVLSITNPTAGTEHFALSTQVVIQSGGIQNYAWSNRSPLTVAAGETFNLTIPVPTADTPNLSGATIIVDASLIETSDNPFNATSEITVNVTPAAQTANQPPVVNPGPVVKLNPHGKPVGKGHNATAILETV